MAFQTLKGKEDHHGNRTGGWRWGFPWELKGQQNFKHLQLKREGEENAVSLPTLSKERENGEILQKDPNKQRKPPQYELGRTIGYKKRASVTA